MLYLLALMLAAPMQAAPSLPPGTIIGLDPRQGPMPVTDKYLLPAKVPDCADRYEAQRAAEQRIRGYTPECFITRKTEPKPR